MKKIFTLITACVISTGIANAQLLHDNGPLVDSPGAGFGGADASTLHDGIINYGFNQNQVIGFMVGDDFTVTAPGGWAIDSIVFFGYQTTSPITSTFTDLRYMIYDGDPANGGTVIYGDTVNSRLINSYWSGIYRVTSTALTDVNCPIMRNVCDAPALTLPAGNYWLAWQAAGSLASGPWNPPISIMGQINTGNAIQYVAANLAWQPMQDTNATAGTGSGGFQGLPFEIYGTSLVGVNNISNDGNSISIAPNPSNGTFTVKTDFSKASNLKITISDLRGRVIYQEKLIDVTKLDKKINLPETPKGVYLMKLYNDSGEVIVKKIVID